MQSDKQGSIKQSFQLILHAGYPSVESSHMPALQASIYLKVPCTPYLPRLRDSQPECVTLQHRDLFLLQTDQCYIMVISSESSTATCKLVMPHLKCCI